MNFRQASEADIDSLLELVNGSYRSRLSWTHECDLLGGDRIGREALLPLLPHVETAWENGLAACVHLHDGHLGLLCVQPGRQRQGVGRRLLEHARALARSWGWPALQLTVLRQRPELIAYYERRGYRLTGQTFQFPTQEGVGAPKRADLELLEMVNEL